MKQDLKYLKNYNMMFVSQVRMDDVQKIPGKGFHEAKNWSQFFNLIIFLCFSTDGKIHIEKLNKKLIVAAVPFDLSTTVSKTVIDLLKTYIRLIIVQVKLIKYYKIDLIREENLILGGIPTIISAKITRTPYMTWLGGAERHALKILYGDSILTRIISFIVIILEILIFRNSSMVFTVSSELFELLKERNVENKFLTPNYVDFTIFTEKVHKKHTNDMVINILYSGRFEKEKGMDNLLNAVKILAEKRKNFVLNLAGYGKLEEWIRNFTKTNNLEDNVKVLGKFQLSELPDVYKNADIFVIPSYTEGNPAALLEAMCSGCVSVCTTVGLIPQYIKNGENGFLVPPGDPQALADSIMHLIDNPEKISEIGRKSRRVIEQSSGKYLSIHGKIYDFIIRKSRK